LNKIFKYELRRLLWNKFFIGLLLINGLYAWFVLTGDIIAGVAYTAPFSPWSFGAYLAKTMPITVLTVLFLLTFYYAKKEKRVEVLTGATPVNPVRYSLVRSGAIATAFLILVALLLGLSLYFYASILDYWHVTPFILPALLVLPPCLIFALGAGHLAGRLHVGLLYVLMLAVLLVGFGGIGGAFDPFGGGYFSVYPLSLPAGADGDPAFTLSAGFLIARAVYLGVGGGLFLMGIGAARKKATTA